MKQNPEVKIRSAQTGDEAELANAHLNSWRETYKGLVPQDYLDNLPLSFKRRMTWFRSVISKPSEYVLKVAEAKEGIVGFALLAEGRDADRAGYAELGAIYLLEKYKGQGVGFALMSSGFNQMKDRGFKKAYCWVLKDNPTLSFYERTGAKSNGQTKTEIFDGIETTDLCLEWADLNVGDYNWKPLSVKELTQELSSITCDWHIAGGWAIDLFLGRETRIHDDIDIIVRRDDQTALQTALADWELWAADPPGTLRPWKKGELLKKGIQDIWCRRSASEPWQIQAMLFDTDGEDWIFKRDESIRKNLNAITLKTKDGLSILAPEVQLLYKSKSLREKDRQDFENSLAAMSSEQKNYLKMTLSKVYQNKHDWISRL